MQMTQSKYPAYKDSGVEWIGIIPEGWEVKALKFIAKLQRGETISPNEFTEEIGYLVYGGGGLRVYTSKYTSDENIKNHGENCRSTMDDRVWTRICI